MHFIVRTSCGDDLNRQLTVPTLYICVEQDSVKKTLKPTNIIR